MGYRITAAEIHDFKRVKDVAITPPADASIVLIGGKNAQGKSSILDALTAALGGANAAPPEPIRHGAKSAEITIEFDGGKLVVQRIINKKGSHLEVRNGEGEIVKSPQAMLDKLVGARFLDPLKFKTLAAKLQRAELMKLIPDAARIETLNASREKAFTRRTEIGRDQDNAKGELERLKATQVPEGEPIDVAKLTAEVKELTKLQLAGVDLNRAHNTCESVVDAERRRANENAADIAKLQAQLAKLQEEVEDRTRNQELLAAAVKKAESEEVVALEKVKASAAAWAATAARRTELDEQLAKADAHNRAIYEASAHRKRLAESEAAAKKLDADYKSCTEAIEKCDERKAAILAAAKLPVPGLTVTDEGVELNGVPFAQASGAEQLRVSVALALAASPNLDDVWVRDAALLDTDHLALVAEMAAAAGKRVWLERVGTADPGVIVIADGQVVS